MKLRKLIFGAKPMQAGLCCGPNTTTVASLVEILTALLLQRLLADVQAGKIDVIVVYKVDRLTRSLADFAKLVELVSTQKSYPGCARR
jgi:hypothetical protein